MMKKYDQRIRSKKVYNRIRQKSRRKPWITEKFERSHIKNKYNLTDILPATHPIADNIEECPFMKTPQPMPSWNYAWGELFVQSIAIFMKAGLVIN